MIPIIRWFSKGSLKVRLHAQRPGSIPPGYQEGRMETSLAPISRGIVLAENPVWKHWLTPAGIEMAASSLAGFGWTETDWKGAALRDQPTPIAPAAHLLSYAPAREVIVPVPAPTKNQHLRVPIETRLATATKGYAERAAALEMDPANKALRANMKARREKIRRLCEGAGLPAPDLMVPPPFHPAGTAKAQVQA